MSPSQKPPQRIEALSTGSSKPATIIFLHGYGDDADGLMNVAQQFQSANKLPHLSWIFPNAPFNQEAMSTAWYPPTSFSPIPVGRSSKPEDEDDDDEFNEEGEDDILQSVEYICGLIDEEVKKGVEVGRIVVGGFSQGCAISLILALASRYAGKIGGVVGLSGYLPRGPKIKAGREKYKAQKGGEEGGQVMKIFLAHGTKDMLVPMRVYRDTKARVAHTAGEEVLETHEYQGMSHVLSGPELRDMCNFLENVVPE